MHLSETASDVIHHRYAVVINRKHIIFHKVVYKHPAGEVGNSAAVLLQIYFSICVQKNYQNTMRFDKVTAKIEGCNFFASQCTRPYLQCRKILFWYKLSWRFFFDEKIGLGPSHNFFKSWRPRPLKMRKTTIHNWYSKGNKGQGEYQRNQMLSDCTPHYYHCTSYIYVVVINSAWLLNVSKKTSKCR